MVGRGRRTGHKVRGLVTDSLEQNVLFLFYSPVILYEAWGGRRGEGGKFTDSKARFQAWERGSRVYSTLCIGLPSLTLWLLLAHP